MSWRGVALMVFAALSGLMAALLPGLLNDADHHTKGPSGELESFHADGKKLAELITRRMRGNPQLVLIGNSMLGTRIDKPLIRELSVDYKAAVLNEGNTFSPIWYLSLKKVAESKRPPKVVVIFFRDRFLTWPEFRFNENGEALASGMMGEISDPLVTRYFSESSSQSRWEEAREMLAEPNRKVQQKVENLSLDISKLENSKDERRILMNERFSIENLRHDVPDDLGAELEGLDNVTMNGYSTPADFQEALDGSLLPDMVTLAKEHNIRLIFFRVKRRPDPVTGLRESSPSLDSYMADLRVWLEARDAVLWDGNDSMEFTLEDYADGDHISRDSRPDFTRWFWQNLQPYLPE